MPFGRGTTRSLGYLLTLVINHLLNGMILQVRGFFLDPPAQLRHLFPLVHPFGQIAAFVSARVRGNDPATWAT